MAYQVLLSRGQVEAISEILDFPENQRRLRFLCGTAQGLEQHNLKPELFQQMFADLLTKPEDDNMLHGFCL